MKIVIFSDCHLEFHADQGTSFIEDVGFNNEAVAVIAGDLASLPMLPNVLGAMCKRFRKVVYVPGNHELYGFGPPDLEKIRSVTERTNSNLHWLNNNTATIDGVLFVGTTLWFPRPTMLMLKRRLSDYVKIKGFEPWVYEQHSRSIEYLKTHLVRDSVLVTHHFPFTKSISQEFHGDLLNVFFHAGSQAEEIVMDKEPMVAIHGHTHAPFDYTDKRTRVVCNPYGYPRENMLFNFSKTIEL